MWSACAPHLAGTRLKRIYRKGKYLLFAWHGGFLLAWGALIVSALDNLLRPRLCGTRIAIHPLLVFVSMFGGLYVFGVMGLLLGPLIAAIFMAMVRIWRRDFLAPATASLAPTVKNLVPAPLPQGPAG